MDYKSPSDDAWYGVRLVLQGDTLIVKYNDFSETYDERFCASDFRTLAEIHAFKDRFRPSSVQLQDDQCSQVVQGMVVCVSYSYSEDDIRFYDALVDNVNFAEHTYLNGEEECSCVFTVLWRHGPLAGIHTETKIGNICVIQSRDGEWDATLESFLKISREKLEMIDHDIDLGSDSGGMIDHDIGGDSGGMIDQDTDLGGESFPVKTEDIGDFHFILIENMEKDLTPVAVVDFIYKHTSVLSHAYVFPSLSMEPFTRGAIVADSRGKLEKIYEFLDDPTHSIMSSKGRPWVMSEKKLRHGAFHTSFGGIMSKSEDELRNRNAEFDDIKVIRHGTEEYKKAKQLKKSFMDFVDNLRGLYHKLTSDEKKSYSS